LPALDHPEDQNNPGLLDYLEYKADAYSGSAPDMLAEAKRRGLTSTDRYPPWTNMLLEDDRRKYLAGQVQL
jgi:hypothetical protein